MGNFRALNPIDIKFQAVETLFHNNAAAIVVDHVVVVSGATEHLPLFGVKHMVLFNQA